MFFDKQFFFGVNLRFLEKIISAKSGRPVREVINAAHEYRHRLETMPGWTDERLSKICEWTHSCLDSVTPEQLTERLVDYWWDDLAKTFGAITPKNQKQHYVSKKPKAKKTEFYARYRIMDQEKFEKIRKKYPNADANYPTIIIRGSKFYLSAVDHDMPVFAVASDYFEL